jgi:hypothetical protein
MARLKDIYESLRPLIVWLGLTELVWISYWLLRTGDANSGYTTAVIAWIVAMLAWLALATYLGRRGFFFEHSRWLSNLVGSVMVITFAVVVFGAIPAVREGLASAATATTNRELASIHILRLLAIGTIIKYLQRELPLHFLILGSLPDFLFAVSAVVVTIFVGNGFIGQEFLVIWHSIGFLVFFGAGISMFFSMPSPFRIYYGSPDTSIVFRFPMLLAPNFTVPLFMLAHVFALVKLTVAG